MHGFVKAVSSLKYGSSFSVNFYVTGKSNIEKLCSFQCTVKVIVLK